MLTEAPGVHPDIVKVRRVQRLALRGTWQFVIIAVVHHSNNNDQIKMIIIITIMILIMIFILSAVVY